MACHSNDESSTKTLILVFYTVLNHVYCSVEMISTVIFIVLARKLAYSFYCKTRVMMILWLSVPP